MGSKIEGQEWEELCTDKVGDGATEAEAEVESSLYDVDDYGMPLTQLGDEEELQLAAQALTSRTGLGAQSILVQCKAEEVLDEQHLALDGHVSKKKVTGPSARSKGKRKLGVDDEQLVKVKAGTLKQSKLYGFLGISPPKPTPSAVGRRLKQQDIRALMKVVAPRPVPGVVRVTADVELMSKGSFWRRWGQRSNQEHHEVVRKCPFYKRMPGTSFTVDAFRYGKIEGCSAYFLTHFHADHYGGLSKKWQHGPIYCTPATARLCVVCLYVDPRWIFPLQMGVSYVIDGVEVRMLDANHCPGAALILFRFKNGNSILHTGDFRACKQMETFPELLSGSINSVYLDTTYCNHRYRFPLQEEVIKFVVRQTQNALFSNRKTLVVVGSYSIGKERVYYGLAEALRVQVFADRNRRRILKSLEWPELESKLTTDPHDTCLHVLPLSSLNIPKLKSYLGNQAQKKYSAVLAFRPTGWTYSEKIGDRLDLIKPQRSGPVTIYGVPYSEHSSFTELRDFVQFLRPKRIIPTVNVARPSDRERMQLFFDEWLQGQ